MLDISLFKTYLDQQNFSEKTKESYVSSIRHYASFFNEITTENINSYQKTCLKFQKPATVNLRLHALASYAKFKNIKITFRFIKTQEPLFSENILTEKEYNKILDYVKEKPEWYILFKVLGSTGIRISETYQIHYSDLSSTKITILGKGTKTREVWFPSFFRKSIAPYLSYVNKKDLINKHDASYIRSKLRHIKKKLKIKAKLSPHEFRRFYAREVYKRTKDIYLVKNLLGHSNIKTTMRYLRISTTGISRRISKIVDW